jgi:hypothetical protein
VSNLLDNETGERLHPDSTITVPLVEHARLLARIDELESVMRWIAEQPYIGPAATWWDLRDKAAEVMKGR